jgi:hypothetical protein
MASATANKPVAPTAERKILLVGASRGLGWAWQDRSPRTAGLSLRPSAAHLAARLAAAAALPTAISVPSSSTSTTRKPCKHCAHSFPRFDVIFIVTGVSDKIDAAGA